MLTYQRLQPRIRQLGLTTSELVGYAMSLSSVFEVPAGETIVATDPDDDVFLRCAVVGGAAYVVSGDDHLLELEEHAGIPILTVRDFLEREFPDRVD